MANKNQGNKMDVDLSKVKMEVEEETASVTPSTAVPSNATPVQARVARESSASEGKSSASATAPEGATAAPATPSGPLGATPTKAGGNRASRKPNVASAGTAPTAPQGMRVGETTAPRPTVTPVPVVTTLSPGAAGATRAQPKATPPPRGATYAPKGPSAQRTPQRTGIPRPNIRFHSAGSNFPPTDKIKRLHFDANAHIAALERFLTGASQGKRPRIESAGNTAARAGGSSEVPSMPTETKPNPAEAAPANAVQGPTGSATTNIESETDEVRQLKATIASLKAAANKAKCQKMPNPFAHKTSEHERERFRRYVQGSDQSVDDYISTKCGMAQLWNIPVHELADALIHGFKDTTREIMFSGLNFSTTKDLAEWVLHMSQQESAGEIAECTNCYIRGHMAINCRYPVGLLKKNYCNYCRVEGHNDLQCRFMKD